MMYIRAVYRPAELAELLPGLLCDVAQPEDGAVGVCHLVVGATAQVPCFVWFDVSPE